MRITVRTIERWGWGVWEAAVRDAEQVATLGVHPEARRAGRNWLRSLYRTRDKLVGTEGPGEEVAR